MRELLFSYLLGFSAMISWEQWHDRVPNDVVSRAFLAGMALLALKAVVLFAAWIERKRGD